MYRQLFALTGPAILAWLLVILLPTWRATRRIAESAIFPAYLSILYVVGIVLVLRESGFGMMQDFGSADGVLSLLRTESVALVAWIHILAFDQVVGLLVYRDNMRHRYVPLPVQSAILFATLMLGPVGFASYWLLRMVRRRAALTAWGERDRTPFVDEPAPMALASVTASRSVAGVLRDLLARERQLVLLAGACFAFAATTAAVAAANGSWTLGAEGRLLEAVKFDVALGLYILTLACILPLAGFSARRHRRWVWTMIAMTVYGLLVENVQNWRGLDPRFSDVASGPERLLGLVFFFTALTIMWLFIDLVTTFFRRDALPDHPLLRDALRWSAGGALLAFGVGIAMSALNSRYTGAAGNMMPIHAAGFHALQAVPLVALWLGWSSLDARTARLALHGAGAGWLLLCVGLIVDAAMGRATPSGSIGTALALSGVAAWSGAAVFAFRTRRVGVSVGVEVATGG